MLTVDTNSHSKLWGNETNSRGKKWEDFFEKEQLLVHNQGRIPTFESKNGKSIIDVTLRYRLPNTLENWRVLRSFNGTDHITIHYSLKGMAVFPILHSAEMWKRGHNNLIREGAAAYQLGNTTSRTITEVKQR